MLRTSLLIATATSLVACAGLPAKDLTEAGGRREFVQEAKEEFAKAVPAIKKVRIGGSLFVSEQVKAEIPAHIASIQINEQFNNTANLDWFFRVLERRYEVPSVFNVSKESRERFLAVSKRRDREAVDIAEGEAVDAPEQFQEQAIEAAALGSRVVSSLSEATGLAAYPLPFRTFKGNLGEAASLLEETLDLSIWWSNDRIFVSEKARFSVAIPKVKGLGDEVKKDLEAFGAVSVAASNNTSMVSYEASRSLNEEVVQPYFERLAGNLNEVTVQVAMVSVLITEENEVGLDWDKLKFAFGEEFVENLGSSTVNVSESVGGTQVREVSNLVTGATDAFKFQMKNASLFGVNRPLSIDGALGYISSVANSRTVQHLEGRALSCNEMKLRSGESIPYVANINSIVGANNAGGGAGGGGNNVNAVGSGTETETVDTGLTMLMTPCFDADGGMVTVNMDLKVNDLVRFEELSGGNQIGTFLRPRIREQETVNTLRIPAGHLAVMGGLRRTVTQEDRNAPLGMWGLGHKAKIGETFALYVVVRPSVTIYEKEDSIVKVSKPVVTETLMSDGSRWYADEALEVADKKLTPAERRKKALEESILRFEDDEDSEAVVQPRGGN